MNRFSIAAAIGLLAVALAMPGTAVAAPQRDALVTGIPVTGTLTDGGTFVGNLTIDSITRTADGALAFGGSLVGTASPTGGVPTAINQTFTAILGSLTGALPGKCDVLFLDLGPLHLDLLGLEVDLSQITLDVNAIPGPGNLLGNLLCAVTHLLDGGPLSALNNLLGIINRLLG